MRDPRATATPMTLAFEAAMLCGAFLLGAIDRDALVSFAQFGISALIAFVVVLIYAELRRRGRGQ